MIQLGGDEEFISILFFKFVIPISLNKCRSVDLVETRQTKYVTECLSISFPKFLVSVNWNKRFYLFNPKFLLVEEYWNEVTKVYTV